MDLPEIQKILLSNTQPKPTQAPPEYLMEIGEYSQVLPRDYLGEARQMADSTAGIMSMSFPIAKLFKMFPKLRGNPLEVLKETPKIIKKLQNKVTNQKINISSGAERQKLLKERSENQKIIDALRNYEKEADDYFRRIVEQPGSMKMSPKFAKEVKEYIKLKDPKKLNINLSKSLDTKEIEMTLKRSDISDSIKALNKAEVLEKPGASFSDRLLASDLKKQSKFKSISEALEELDKLD